MALLTLLLTAHAALMDRVRAVDSEEGQTSLEWLGIAVVVAVLIGAVAGAAGGIGGEIASGISSMISNIVGFF